MNMTDAGTTQDNCILPAPPVGGLSISQDRRDKMTFVRNRTIPITLPSGMNVLADTMLLNQYTAHLPWHEVTLVQTWQQILPFRYLQYQYGLVLNKTFLGFNDCPDFNGNLMDIMVLDGKTVAQATKFPSHEPSV